MKKAFLLLAFLILLIPAYSQASVTYDFTAYSDNDNGTYLQPKSFTLTVADYITTDIYYYTGDAGFTSTDYPKVHFVVDAVAAHYTATPSQVVAAGSKGYCYYFAPGSFTTDGTYDSFLIDDQHAHLTVSSSIVPLPGAVLLFAPGLAGLGLLRRRMKK